MNSKETFFILGCVRSGTTLLRDLLKMHPHLICPEETHMFRWGEPFHSSEYLHVNKFSDTLISHRKMDGVDESDFLNILDVSMDKSDFMLRYMKLFKEAQSNTSSRCFDKTPQNVYGLPLIKAYFPKAKIIHIVRNPLNVVASLKQGKVLAAQTLTGAINFWKESILIINTLKPLLNDNLYEFKYEDLTNDPVSEISRVLDFLGEPPMDSVGQYDYVNPAKNSYHEILDVNEIDTVNQELSELMQLYGY
ncbi:MAG: sulfotransferase [Proteobacteria bacterium]|nr:sulfotransferase [Pseudomonadota bacterium]